MITTESIVKDFKKRILGGKSYSSNASGNMVVDQKAGKVRWFDDGGNLIGEYGILEGTNRVGFRTIDENGDNRFFTGRDDDFYGYKMSKPGTDVFDNDDSEILLGSDSIFLQSFFGTYAGGVSATNIFTTGLVGYWTSNWNFITRLPFYKPTDFILTEAEVNGKFYDGISVSPAQTTRMLDLDILLNPTTRTYENITGGGQYIRYSGGSLVLDDYDVAADGDSIPISLSAAQLAEIKDGWNELVLQQRTSFNPTSNPRYGYGLMNLVLSGYKLL